MGTRSLGIPLPRALRWTTGFCLVACCHFTAGQEPVYRAPPRTTTEFMAAENEIPRPDVMDGDFATAGLTLDELEGLALAASPSLAEAGARLEAARGKSLQAGLGPNPEIGYSGQQLGSGGQSEMHGAVLTQKFVRGGKLELSRAVECEEVHRLQALWAVQQQRVITDVRIAFYSVLSAQKQRDLARQLVDINTKALGAVESLVQAKEGSKVDVLQAQIELEAVTANLHQAEFELAGAWRRLVALIGQPDLTEQELSGDLESDQAAMDLEGTWQQLMAESPEIAAARFAVERACRNLQLQHAVPVSDVDVQAMLQHDQAINGLNGNLQITFPLRVVNRNQGGIQQAAAELAAARRALERKELELRGKLVELFAMYQTARSQVQRYRQAILPKAAENLTLVRRGFDAGEFGFIQVLTVQRTYAERNAIYLQALRELWTRKLEIEGLLLKDSLSDF